MIWTCLLLQTHALQAASVLFVLRVVWAVFILPETLPVFKRAKKTKHGVQNPIRSMSILFRSQLFIHLTALIALTAFIMNGMYQIRMFYLNVSQLVWLAATFASCLLCVSC